MFVGRQKYHAPIATSSTLAHLENRKAHMKAARPMTAGMLIAASGFAPNAAQAQEGIKRTDLQQHDLSTPGREVIQTRVDLAPGAAFPRHKHPGEEIIYIVEGAIEYEVEGKPPVTLKAGDVL